MKVQLPFRTNHLHMSRKNASGTCCTISNTASACRSGMRGSSTCMQSCCNSGVWRTRNACCRCSPPSHTCWTGCSGKRMRNSWRMRYRSRHGSLLPRPAGTKNSGTCQPSWSIHRRPLSASSTKTRMPAVWRAWQNCLKIRRSGASWQPRRKSVPKSACRNTGTGSTGGCSNTTRSTACRRSATNAISVST